MTRDIYVAVFGITSTGVVCVMVVDVVTLVLVVVVRVEVVVEVRVVDEVTVEETVAVTVAVVVPDVVEVTVSVAVPVAVVVTVAVEVPDVVEVTVADVVPDVVVLTVAVVVVDDVSVHVAAVVVVAVVVASRICTFSTLVMTELMLVCWWICWPTLLAILRPFLVRSSARSSQVEPESGLTVRRAIVDPLSKFTVTPLFSKVVWLYAAPFLMLRTTSSRTDA